MANYFAVNEQVRILVLGNWVYGTLVDVDMVGKRFKVSTAIGEMMVEPRDIRKVGATEPRRTM